MLEFFFLHATELITYVMPIINLLIITKDLNVKE